MQIFDLTAMTAYHYSERKENVFYQAPRFKARIIELPAGGAMPDCEMASHVLFYVIRGEAKSRSIRKLPASKRGSALSANQLPFQ
jgi:hypothetical protein